MLLNPLPHHRARHHLHRLGVLHEDTCSGSTQLHSNISQHQSPIRRRVQATEGHAASLVVRERGRRLTCHDGRQGLPRTLLADAFATALNPTEAHLQHHQHLFDHQYPQNPATVIQQIVMISRLRLRSHLTAKTILSYPFPVSSSLHEGPRQSIPE
jgi:hypothetical protein